MRRSSAPAPRASPPTPLPFDEALRIVLGAAPSPRTEEIPFEEAVGRVLARDVRADRDLPPFDRAALDGYAVRVRGEFGARHVLAIAGEIAAGTAPGPRLRAGTCVRIWTGAPVPAGAQGIVPVERAREENGSAVLDGPLAGDGVRRQGIADRGEDARSGSLLLERGHTITLGDLAVLAAVGRARVAVRRWPSVAILATGHELVAPEKRPGPGQIRTTNDAVVAALARAAGAASVTRLGIVGDRERPLRQALLRGLDHDVLVVTGGVSAGRLDLVPGLLEEIGVRILLHKVAIRPGRPFLFGMYKGAAARRRSGGRGTRGTAVFGLPGNPMSVLVTALEFLAPYMRAWAGERHPAERCATAGLRGPIRRGAGLLHFLPCALSSDASGRLWAEVLDTHGSGDFVSGSRAGGFARVPGDGAERPAGSLVRVDFLPGTQPITEVTA